MLAPARLRRSARSSRPSVPFSATLYSYVAGGHVERARVDAVGAQGELRRLAAGRPVAGAAHLAVVAAGDGDEVDRLLGLFAPRPGSRRCPPTRRCTRRSGGRRRPSSPRGTRRACPWRGPRDVVEDPGVVSSAVPSACHSSVPATRHAKLVSLHVASSTSAATGGDAGDARRPAAGAVTVMAAAASGARRRCGRPSARPRRAAGTVTDAAPSASAVSGVLRRRTARSKTRRR